MSSGVHADVGLTGGGEQESDFSPLNDASVKGLHCDDTVGSRTRESTTTPSVIFRGELVCFMRQRG